MTQSYLPHYTVLALCITVLSTQAQDPPKDLFGEQPAPCYGWMVNKGQLLGTDGTPVKEKITNYQHGSPVDIYLQDRATASFAWSTNDLDTNTADTTYRVDMVFSGAKNPTVHQLTPFPGVTNFYKGGIGQEVEDVPTFGDVLWENVYDNIDVDWSSNKAGAKLYIVLNPGADPNDLIMKFVGADSCNLDVQGVLRPYLKGKWVELRQAIAYQVIGASAVAVPWTANWELLTEANTARLTFGSYDTSYPLVLLFCQPEGLMAQGGSIYPPMNMTWSTYVGSNLADELTDVTVDASGNPYVCGYAFDPNFPVNTGYQQFPPQQATFMGTEEMVIMKFDKVNKQIIWATWHGGSTFALDEANAIVAYMGNEPSKAFVYVVGTTHCSDFPIGHWHVPSQFDNAYVRDNNYSNVQATVAAYNATNGVLYWATMHGPVLHGYSERGICIDLDQDGTLVIGGALSVGVLPTMPEYQVTPAGAFTRGNGGGFFLVFDHDYDIKWCSAFGRGNGSLYTFVQDIKIARRSIAPFNKVIYLTGTDFGDLDTQPSPISGAYFQQSPGGTYDAYLARLDIESDYQLEYSTYWGGNQNERGHALALNDVGDQLDVYMVGVSHSTDLNDDPNLLRLPDPGNGALHHTTSAGGADGFLLRFSDATDNFTWGTLYGGLDGDGFNDVTVGPGEQLFLTGETRSNSGIVNADNFGLYSQNLMGLDFATQHMDPFLLVTTKYGQPVWNTYFGGTKTDKGWGIATSADELYMVGGTNSDQFTFPLHEFDETSPLDWYDGDHFNNANGTHGGLDYWGFFRGGFGTLIIDDAATEPDGFICSFNISPNVGIIEHKPYNAVVPLYMGEGIWYVPMQNGEAQLAELRLFDATGRALPVKYKSDQSGVQVDLTSSAKGIYLVQVTSNQGSTYCAKLVNQ